jgi:single-strand selective monofunctional uracil DNA glycosylase
VKSAPPLVRISREQARALSRLRIGAPVAHVYHPIDYAREPWERYLRRYGGAPKEAIFVGMNPGPWGMAQTGVPFGTVALVRDWLGIEGRVGTPRRPHPKRPVLGFACPRREISGERFWGWARRRFATPDRFFERFFVWNYCPLLFLDAAGRNLTPDRLPAAGTGALLAICDRALRRTAEVLRPRVVIGVGRFAEKRARAALEGMDLRVGHIPHPSPASPLANSGWEREAEAALRLLGIRMDHARSARGAPAAGP